MITRRTFHRSFLSLFALAAAPSWARMQTFAKAGDNHAAAALDLFHQLRGKEGNLFFSPYSISAAFGMVGAGAKENTAAEIAKAFHFGSMDAAFHQRFGELSRTLLLSGNKEGDILAIANALCVTGSAPKDDYLKLIKASYDAQIFSGDVNVINAWVKEKTRGKIDQILEKLNPNSAFVLLNAVYFKGSWKLAFPESSTKDRDFSVSADKTTKVKMMRQKANFRMIDQDTWQVIDLPYATGISMTVLLPKQRNGHAAAQEKLDAAGLAAVLKTLDESPERKVDLFLPKFKMSTSYDLTAPLKKAGIKDAFDMSVADFTPMGFSKGDICISQAMHKAIVEVTEKGTEAAAVTAVELATRSLPPPTPTFTADHPFLFLIRDQSTGTILFLGRVTNPAAE
jgi:serpin B